MPRPWTRRGPNFSGVELRHIERDIIEYWHDDSGEHPAIQSMWFLRLFERRDFMGLVLAS